MSVYGIEKDDKELPAGSVVIGSNGQFEVSSSEIFQFVRKLEDKNPLNFKDINEGVKILKKIPWEVFWQGPKWLRKQWDIHCTGKGKSSKEFIILLFYNPESKEYFWYPPIQKGSSASLNYTTSNDEKVLDLVGKGNLCVGTMHNHFGKGTAFQSGTDHKDEVDHGMPMVHFTMAYMDAPHLYSSEFHIRFVCGDLDKTLRFKDIVESQEPEETPAEWDERLKIEYSPPPVKSTSRSGGTNYGSGFYGKYNDSQWMRDWYGGGYGEYGFGGEDFDDLYEGRHGHESSVKIVDIDEDADLNCSEETIRLGFESDAFKAIRGKYRYVEKIGGGNEAILAKAICFELIRDLKHATLGVGDGMASGMMDDVDSFEFMVDIMKVVCKIDDYLESFLKEQNDLLRK